MTTGSTHHPAPVGGPRKSDRLIPWYFVGAFGVILFANLCLIVFSQTSWVGLVTDHPFEEGNNYNEAISDAQAQAALGWRSKITVSGVMDHNATISVLFRDHDSKPIAGAKMEAVLTRNDRDDIDQKVMLAEVAPGEYRSQARIPVYGNWQLRLIAHTKDHDYQTVEDVLVEE